jgi:hypothetical protein
MFYEHFTISVTIPSSTYDKKKYFRMPIGLGHWFLLGSTGWFIYFQMSVLEESRR